MIVFPSTVRMPPTPTASLAVFPHKSCYFVASFLLFDCYLDSSPVSIFCYHRDKSSINGCGLAERTHFYRGAGHSLDDRFGEAS